MAESSNVHVVEGRLRIRVPAVKGSAEIAARMEMVLGALPAVTSVTASLVTGSVIVFHDERTMSAGEILEIVQALGGSTAAPLRPESAPRSRFDRPLARLVIETALHQAVTTLLFPPCSCP